MVIVGVTSLNGTRLPTWARISHGVWRNHHAKPKGRYPRRTRDLCTEIYTIMGKCVYAFVVAALLLAALATAAEVTFKGMHAHSLHSLSLQPSVLMCSHVLSPRLASLCRAVVLLSSVFCSCLFPSGIAWRFPHMVSVSCTLMTTLFSYLHCDSSAVMVTIHSHLCIFLSRSDLSSGSAHLYLCMTTLSSDSSGLFPLSSLLVFLSFRHPRCRSQGGGSFI